jgi:hypothetical protein
MDWVYIRRAELSNLILGLVLLIRAFGSKHWSVLGGVSDEIKIYVIDLHLVEYIA